MVVKEKEWTMSSKRKFKRYALITALDVVDVATNEQAGMLVDISTEGVGIRTRHTYQKDDMFRLRIALPVTLLGADTIEMDARCAWSGRDDNPDLFMVGFQFMNVMPDVVEIIQTLILRYQK